MTSSFGSFPGAIVASIPCIDIDIVDSVVVVITVYSIRL